MFNKVGGFGTFETNMYDMINNKKQVAKTTDRSLREPSLCSTTDRTLREPSLCSTTDKTEKKGKAQEKDETKLSSKAQALLEKLRKMYGDMDIMVADYSDDDEAQSILSRGTKEYSVLFSTEELEKMAADEEYGKQQMGRIEEAVDMSKKIEEQFGAEAAKKTEGDSTVVTKIGVSFNSDGTATYFAELEQLTQSQKERLEQSQAEKKEQLKEEEKKAEKKEQEEALLEKIGSGKTTSVKADSMEELISKIQSVDWGAVKEPSSRPGIKLDITV